MFDQLQKQFRGYLGPNLYTAIFGKSSQTTQRWYHKKCVFYVIPNCASRLDSNLNKTYNSIITSNVDGANGNDDDISERLGSAEKECDNKLEG